MKKKEVLCHFLCAEREANQTSLAKKSGGVRDEEAGREVEREKRRQKHRRK